MEGSWKVKDGQENKPKCIHVSRGILEGPQRLGGSGNN